MKTFRAAVSGLMGIICAGCLQSCGGYVDIYDTNGKLIKQLIAGGGANGVYGRIDLTNP
jgi:hypothetical protein